MNSWETVNSFCLMSLLCAAFSAQAWNALHNQAKCVTTDQELCQSIQATSTSYQYRLMAGCFGTQVEDCVSHIVRLEACTTCNRACTLIHSHKHRWILCSEGVVSNKPLH